jgi:hypothetical protein
MRSRPWICSGKESRPCRSRSARQDLLVGVGLVLLGAEEPAEDADAVDHGRQRAAAVGHDGVDSQFKKLFHFWQRSDINSGNAERLFGFKSAKAEQGLEEEKKFFSCVEDAKGLLLVVRLRLSCRVPGTERREQSVQALRNKVLLDEIGLLARLDGVSERG